jgi:amicyanin
MKVIILVVAIVLIIIIGGYFLISGMDTNNLSKESSNNQEISEENEEIIKIKDFSFIPSSIVIKKGMSVIWINMDSVEHTITSDIGTELDSALLSKEEKYSHKFNKVGVFNYHCTPHPFMKGEVVVEE